MAAPEIELAGNYARQDDLGVKEDRLLDQAADCSRDWKWDELKGEWGDGGCGVGDSGLHLEAKGLGFRHILFQLYGSLITPQISSHLLKRCSGHVHSFRRLHFQPLSWD